MEYSNCHEIYHGGVGFKVLLVDKDTNSLMYMSRILEEHSYRVTTTTHGSSALSMIFERRNMFDLIITEIDMPGMDGFQFLNQITSKVDIPTLLITTMKDIELTRKALKEGACFFFHKPIAQHNLVNVWQHVLRYRVEKHQLKKGLSPREVEKHLEVLHRVKKSSSHLSNSMEMGNSRMIETSTISIDDQFRAKSGNHIGESSQVCKRGREDDETFNSGSSTSSSSVNINRHEDKQKEKARRLTWTLQLQHKFQESYEALGENRATPLRIKELMNEPDITIQNISSYLQKFRKRIKAKKDEATKQKFLSNYSALHSCSSRQLSWSSYSPIHTTANLVPNVGLNYYNISTMEYPTQYANTSNSVPISANKGRNIFGKGNFGSGLQPLEPTLPTSANNQWQTKIESPNLISLRDNFEVSKLTPLRKPQVLQKSNGGLGMTGDIVRAREFVDEVPKVHERNCGLGMERNTTDTDQELTEEEIQDLLHRFSDDGSNTLYSSSPEGNVSSCSITQHVGANLKEGDMEKFLTMLEVPENSKGRFIIS